MDSDGEHDGGGGEVVEFGFQEEEKKIGGRRAKKLKEQKKKMKAGSFGKQQGRQGPAHRQAASARRDTNLGQQGRGLSLEYNPYDLSTLRHGGSIQRPKRAGWGQGRGPAAAGLHPTLPVATGATRHSSAA